MFMGLMAVPNLIAIFFLSNKVVKVLNHYDQQTLEEVSIIGNIGLSKNIN